jgi:hypothetical protein
MNRIRRGVNPMAARGGLKSPFTALLRAVFYLSGNNEKILEET